MNSILYDLFTGRYRTELPVSQTLQEQYQRLEPMEDKIKETFGLKFLDQLNQLHEEIDQQHDYASFRSGFLLGTRMMLEALEVKSF